MKPLQIGLLVVVGAIGGAMIMKFTQPSPPVAAPITTAAPVSSAASAPAAQPVAPTPAASVPENAEPAPEPVKPAPMPPAVKPAKAVHASAPAKPKPVRTTVRTVVAQARPQVEEEPQAPPAPAPEPPAPAPVETAPAPEPASEPPAPAAETAPAPVPAAPAPSVTLPAGMLIAARLGESLSSEHNQAGDTFTATLDAPLVAGGFVIAERGARVEGRVVEAEKAGRTRGAGKLTIELVKLHTSDGQRVAIRTDAFQKHAASTTRSDVEKVAALAGIGAAIGAIAGGGKGAGIGAAAGGVAGVGTAVATRSSVATLPSETKVSFRLSEPVTLTERTNP